MAGLRSSAGRSPCVPCTAGYDAYEGLSCGHIKMSNDGACSVQPLCGVNEHPSQPLAFTDCYFGNIFLIQLWKASQVVRFVPRSIPLRSSQAHQLTHCRGLYGVTTLCQQPVSQHLTLLACHAQPMTCNHQQAAT